MTHEPVEIPNASAAPRAFDLVASRRRQNKETSGQDHRSLGTAATVLLDIIGLDEREVGLAEDWCVVAIEAWADHPRRRSMIKYRVDSKAVEPISLTGPLWGTPDECRPPRGECRESEIAGAGYPS